MFTKIFALFALVAVALAAPNPKPEPQVFAYSTGLDYAYPAAAAVPSVVSPYYSAPLAYSTYTGYPGAVYVR